MFTMSYSLNNYYQELPENIIQTVAASAAISFAIKICFRAESSLQVMDLTEPLAKAAVAAVASTIHALATPLFNYIFGKSNTRIWFYEVAKSCIVGASASVLIGLTEPSRFSLSAVKLYYLISLNSIVAFFGPKNTQLNENSIYFC